MKRCQHNGTHTYTMLTNKITHKYSQYFQVMLTLTHDRQRTKFITWMHFCHGFMLNNRLHVWICLSNFTLFQSKRILTNEININENWSSLQHLCLTCNLRNSLLFPSARLIFYFSLLIFFIAQQKEEKTNYLLHFTVLCFKLFVKP